MADEVTPRWKRRAGLAAGAALFVLGLDLVSITSRVLTLAGVLLGGTGLVWFSRALVLRGPRDGWPYRRRRQIALLLATSATCLVLAVSVTASIRLGPSERLRRMRVGELQPEGGDEELGWAPQAPPQYVGQRLHVIDPAREQIVLLGDSILYGLSLRDDETAAHYLGEKLSSLQVVNASVSGYSIDQYYLYLRRILPRMRPRAVVIGLFSGNDFQVTGLEYSWGHSKPLFTAQGEELVLSGKASTCIDQLAQSLLFRVLWTRVDTARATIQLFCGPRQLTLAEDEATISLLFRKMDALAAERGVPLVYALLPTRGGLRTRGGDEYKYLAKYRDLHRLLVEGHHATLAFLPERAGSKLTQDELFIDGGHFTALGQRMLADEIYRYLTTRAGLLP